MAKHSLRSERRGCEIVCDRSGSDWRDVIATQWQRLMQEGFLAKIPNKVDSEVVAVHNDDARDKDGESTYLLGAQVNPDGDPPEEMMARKVPAGRYVLFTSEKGPAAVGTK